jgi:hypothetical protein
MSGRIAHRPRYRNTHHYVHSSFNARQKFFPKRWTYRSQKPTFERHPLGYGLSSLIPASYYTLKSLVQYQV